MEILSAFEDDRYLPKGVKYKHSHYWHYIKFRTLCGCRPSEAIALTWEDIKRSKDGRVLSRYLRVIADRIFTNLRDRADVLRAI